MECKNSERLLVRIKDVNKNQILAISRSEQTGTTLRFKGYSLFYTPRSPLVVFTFSKGIAKTFYTIYMNGYFLDIRNITDEELTIFYLLHPEAYNNHFHIFFEKLLTLRTETV